MRVTRDEACAILEIEEGADHETIRKAYCKKSLQCHPDKHPEERRQEATAKFQKIGASYKKLVEGDSDSEDDFGMDESDFDDFASYIFEMFAAHMNARMGGGRRGGEFRGGGGYGGGGVFVNLSGGGVRGGYAFYPVGGYGSDDYSSEDERDEEWWRQYHADREKAEEQRRIQNQREAAARAEAALREQRDRWMAKLGRLTKLNVTDTTIKISADHRNTRLVHFPTRQLPNKYYWELQYRPLTATGVAPGNWMTISVSRVMETEVVGLTPGTQYAFRARPCVVDDDEKTLGGEWNVETKIFTTGSADKKSDGGGGTASTPGQGKKAKKKAKQAGKLQHQDEEVDEEARAAAAAVEAKAKKDKEDAFAAAMAAAAADYAAVADKAKAAAEKQQAKEAAEAKFVTGKSQKQQCNGTSNGGGAASAQRGKKGTENGAARGGSKSNKKKNKAAKYSANDSAYIPGFAPEPQPPAAAPRGADQPAMLPPRFRSETPAARNLRSSSNIAAEARLKGMTQSQYMQYLEDQELEAAIAASLADAQALEQSYTTGYVRDIRIEEYTSYEPHPGHQPAPVATDAPAPTIPSVSQARAPTPPVPSFAQQQQQQRYEPINPAANGNTGGTGVGRGGGKGGNKPETKNSSQSFPQPPSASVLDNLSGLRGSLAPPLPPQQQQPPPSPAPSPALYGGSNNRNSRNKQSAGGSRSYKPYVPVPPPAPPPVTPFINPPTPGRTVNQQQYPQHQLSADEDADLKEMLPFLFPGVC